MELIAKEDVIPDHTFVYNIYRDRVLKYLELFRSSIENGNGKAEFKMKDIRNMLGHDDFKKRSDNNIYMRVKDILLEFGIKVKLHHHYGCNLVMIFAEESEIRSEIGVIRERERKVAYNAGFSNWVDYTRSQPSFIAKRQTDMRKDEVNRFYFVYIGKKYVAPILFPGAIINKNSLGPRNTISGYDWKLNGVKIKHIASRLRHIVGNDGHERDVFEWLVGKNEVADAFLLTGWGKIGKLELLKAWIFAKEDIVNNRKFWNRISFLISTHKRSMLKYSKYEVDEERLDKVRDNVKSISPFDVYPNENENENENENDNDIEDIRKEIAKWYSVKFRTMNWETSHETDKLIEEDL